MPPSNSASFTMIKAGDETNTLTDLSGYVNKATVAHANQAIDGTTFATGGGMPTEATFKGSMQSIPAVDMIFDPTIINFLNRILGARGGSTWQFFNGTNTIPTFGDQLYQGTFTLFGIALVYHKGQQAKITLDLKPTEGGLVIPGWYPA